jgi:hypothetical protein
LASDLIHHGHSNVASSYLFRASRASFSYTSNHAPPHIKTNIIASRIHKPQTSSSSTSEARFISPGDTVMNQHQDAEKMTDENRKASPKRFNQCLPSSTSKIPIYTPSKASSTASINETTPFLTPSTSMSSPGYLPSYSTIVPPTVPFLSAATPSPLAPPLAPRDPIQAPAPSLNQTVRTSKLQRPSERSVSRTTSPIVNTRTKMQPSKPSARTLILRKSDELSAFRVPS